MKFDDFVNILKEELLKSLVKSSTTWLVSKLPFLGWGPLAPILNLFLTKFLKFLIYESEMACYFLFVELRVNKQGKDFYNALEAKFKAIEGGNPDEIKKTEKDAIDAFRNLVKLTN